MTHFADASIVVQRGVTVNRILPGPQIVGYKPRKRQKMAEITSFAEVSIVVYQGSNDIEIHTGPQIVGFNP